MESVKEELDTENVVTLKGPSFAVEVMEHADTLLNSWVFTQKKQYETVSIK